MKTIFILGLFVAMSIFCLYGFIEALDSSPEFQRDINFYGDCRPIYKGVE